MRVEILTIFPDLFSGFLACSLIDKSIKRGLLEVRVTNIRDFAEDPHKRVDDIPYGGGAGMVMKPEPLYDAHTAAKLRLPKAWTILLSASGNIFKQELATHLSSYSQMILVCGRYE